MHLDGALRVAQVDDFVLESLVFDRLNVGFDVILHVRPGEVPVRPTRGGIIISVPLAVLGAPVIANPYIVSLVGQKQMERLLVTEILDPRRAILHVPVLDKN